MSTLKASTAHRPRKEPVDAPTPARDPSALPCQCPPRPLGASPPKGADASSLAGHRTALEGIQCTIECAHGDPEDLRRTLWKHLLQCDGCVRVRVTELKYVVL